MGRVHVDSLILGAGLRRWRQTPCPGQARLPGWWGRAASGDVAGAVLHGGINLLTQGSAGTLWRVARCLAFCQPTNPLTRPEHALLTPPQPDPTNLAAHGPSQGWGCGGRRGSGRPCPWPGISVQTHIPGPGAQTGLANSAASCCGGGVGGRTWRASHPASLSPFPRQWNGRPPPRRP